MQKIFLFFFLTFIINFVFAQTPLWKANYDMSATSRMQTGFSDDSKYYAYGSDNGEVIIVEAISGNIYHKYKSYEKQIFCTLFQPHGSILASGDKNGKLVLYDYISKKEVRTIDAHSDAITNIYFNKEGDKLISGSKDKSAKIWDVATGKIISEIKGIKGGICTVRFTPDGRNIIVGTNALSNGVRVFDVVSGKETMMIKSNLTEYVDISPDGNCIATANLKKDVKIWDLNTGESFFSLYGHAGDIKYVSYNPVKNILASASKDKNVKFWNIEQRSAITSLKADDDFESIFFSPDGKYFVTLNYDKYIRMWKVSDLVKNYESCPDAAVAQIKKSDDLQQKPISKNTVVTINSKEKNDDLDRIADYRRSSLTILFLNFKDKDPYSNELEKAFNEINIPEKFNNNQIDVKYIIPNFEMRTDNCAELKIKDQQILDKFDIEKSKKILELLQKEKVASKIMAKWFNKTPDGKFDMNLVYERGLYNATDAEYNDAKYTHRGITTELKDAGQRLVDKSYVLVIDFGNILTFEQFDKIKTYQKGNTQTKRGYQTNPQSYLFKLNGDVTQKVYDIWDDGSKFEQLDFPLIPVAQFFDTYARSMSDLDSIKKSYIYELVREAIYNAEYLIASKFEDFRVKAPIFKARHGLFPAVYAKIGKKEDITVDHRFFVWEVTEDKEGKKIIKRRGVVRASNKIIDNRSITTGNTGTSKFYQIQGRRLHPGMILQQKNDEWIGLNIGTGYALNDFGNAKTKIKYKSPLIFTARIDITISNALAWSMKKWPTDFRIYIELSRMGKAPVAEGQTFPDSISPTSLKSNTVGAFGISKDIHIMNNIKLSPFVKYNIARQLTIKNHGSDNKYQLKLFQLGYGCRLPISLTYWMEFVPGITLYKDRKLKKIAESQDKIMVSPMYIDFTIRFSY